MTEPSIVEYYSFQEGYKCGYCMAENTSYSHGMWTRILSPMDYQNLIDRGWRRTGKYCYKPTMHLTCCPQYQIRCEALRFTLSRSQKKVLKKVHKFLSYGEQERTVSAQHSESSNQPLNNIHGIMDMKVLRCNKKVSEICKSDIETTDLGSSCESKVTDVSSKDEKETSTSDVSNIPSDSIHVNPKIYPLSPVELKSDRPCQKAKKLRQERKLQKLLKKGASIQEAMSSVQKMNSESKTIENFLSEPFPVEPVYKLELRLVPSSLENPLFSKTLEESYSIYKKYQMAIHNNPPEKCSQKQYIWFLVKNPFQLRLVPSDFDVDEFKSTFVESYNLYKKYITTIHNDPEEACDQDSFKDFLVETPFEHLDGVSSGETSIYGSFHQQYWLNDKLIAVGVIDVLPYCVYSVYFYYDPDYNFLSLGTYAALREIAFTRELNKTYPDIQYYYMGFYIHSCLKMRYKEQYHPSYLLCPETYIFQPIQKCKLKFDMAKYHRLEEDLYKEDCDGDVNLQDILILYNQKQMSYLSYREVNNHADDETFVREYAVLVGKKCYKRMLLFRG